MPQRKVAYEWEWVGLFSKSIYKEMAIFMKGLELKARHWIPIVSMSQACQQAERNVDWTRCLWLLLVYLTGAMDNTTVRARDSYTANLHLQSLGWKILRRAPFEKIKIWSTLHMLTYVSHTRTLLKTWRNRRFIIQAAKLSVFIVLGI